MTYPFKKVFITQKWGVNGDVYARFGFKGHNGVDLRLFDENGNKASTALVFAPHDGVVRERRNDEDGYGLYLKIESDVEGSILGHLKEFKVGINKHVKQGDLIAIADNTGWSTGAHLHWGYYRLPRNRNNGYGGTIDPIPYLKEESMPTPGMVEVPSKTFEDLVKKSSLLDAIRTTLGSDSATEIKQWIDEYKKSIMDKNQEIKNERERADLARKELNNLVQEAAKALNTVQEPNQIIAALKKVESQLELVEDLQLTVSELQLSKGKEREELEAEIARLKAIVQHGDISKLSFQELLEEIIKRLVGIVRKS